MLFEEYLLQGEFLSLWSGHWLWERGRSNWGDPTFHGRNRFQEGTCQQMVGWGEVGRWLKGPFPSLPDLRLR